MRSIFPYPEDRGRIVAALALVAVVFQAPMTAAAKPRGTLGQLVSVDKGRAVVAVIGINDYSDWPRLDNAQPDAMGILDTLVERFGFDSPLPPLLNESATKDAIIGLVEGPSLDRDAEISTLSRRGFVTALCTEDCCEGRPVPDPGHSRRFLSAGSAYRC